MSGPLFLYYIADSKRPSLIPLLWRGAAGGGGVVPYGEVPRVAASHRVAPHGALPRNTNAFMSLPYNPKLKIRARELRKAGNLSEVLLWLKRSMTLNERDAYLMGLGLSILHISDNDVKKNLEGVIATVKPHHGTTPPKHHPAASGGTPPKEGNLSAAVFTPTLTPLLTFFPQLM